LVVAGRFKHIDFAIDVRDPLAVKNPLALD